MLLETVDLSVAFGGVRAVDGVDLQVPAESIVGLIGPNGAGKTTTFNLISGLTRPDAGVIRYGGEDISSASAKDRARIGIGRSFQNLGIVREESALVNLLAAQYGSSGYGDLDVILRPSRWWRSERSMRERALEIAGEFGIADALDRRVGDLSFAQARFVELACVLSEDPALLLLDEPTTGLDNEETRLLAQVLRVQRSAGKTILLVAHDVRFVMDLCDDVFVLAQGRVLSHGDPQAVQRDPRVISAYLGRAA